MRQLVAGGCSIALSLACQGDDWIIGSELPRDTQAPSGPGGNPELLGEAEACPSAADVLGQRPQSDGAARVDPAHLGRWRGGLGGAAAAGFPSREVELRVGANGSGTLRFDAPPREGGGDDPERGHLCSSTPSGVVCGSVSGFVGGFAYPISRLQSRERVLSFAVVTADPWGSWCAQQTPVHWEDASQACGFAFGVQPRGESRWSAEGCTRIGADGAQDIDCELMYALEFCQCARDACFASLAEQVEVGFELGLDGASLHGSLWYDDDVNASSIVLTRVP